MAVSKSQKIQAEIDKVIDDPGHEAGTVKGRGRTGASPHIGIAQEFLRLGDPYVLISILSVLHEGAWTLDQVQGTLETLFDRQYILTEDVVVEVRYRTESRTDTPPCRSRPPPPPAFPRPGMGR